MTPLFQCVFCGAKFHRPEHAIDAINNGCTVARYNAATDTTIDDELVEVTEKGLGRIIEKPTNRHYPK